MISGDLQTVTAARAFLAALEARDKGFEAELEARRRAHPSGMHHDTGDPRRDQGAAAHCWRVAGLATCLFDWHTRSRRHPRDSERLATLQLGAVLHDIGKLGTREAVLWKPDRLDRAERAEIERHVVIGDQLLRRYPGFREAREIVRFHHERYNGSGYPDGLRGGDIPFLARIVAICDVYEALTEARVYRDPLRYAEAREEIAAGAGTHFDPWLVETFCAIPEEVWVMAAQ